jgi:hypothetical protein
MLDYGLNIQMRCSRRLEGRFKPNPGSTPLLIVVGLAAFAEYVASCPQVADMHGDAAEALATIAKALHTLVERSPL